MSFVHLPRVVRNANFGLAVLYAALFAASAVILGLVVYWTVQASLERQMTSRIDAEINLLQEEFRSEGLQELVKEVQERAAYYPALNYLVMGSNGNRLAGNLPTIPQRLGWTEVETESGRQVPTHPLEKQFWVRSVTLGNGVRLAVGDDLGPLEEIQQAFLEALGWVLLAFLVLSLFGGLLLSRGFLRRVDAITHTAEAIIDGDLDRRVPLRGTNDNFDQLASTLNRMLDRIAHLMDSLGQVSNDIAHALRTPLGRLRQKLEVARANTKRHSKNEQGIDAAIAETDTILDTFSALLRIAQIEAGSRCSGFREVDISKLFETVVDAYSAAAEDQGKDLVSRIEPGLIGRGDQELLTEMLANLFDNAVRHTPKGTRIEVLLTNYDSKLVARIADNGPGVPDDERARVFRRFYRLERSMKTPGSGRGLSLVAAVADLHGIGLHVEDNAPGMRITLTFEAHQSIQPNLFHQAWDSHSGPRPERVTCPIAPE
jgi:signal transduction histidine kinase